MNVIIAVIVVALLLAACWFVVGEQIKRRQRRYRAMIRLAEILQEWHDEEETHA